MHAHREGTGVPREKHKINGQRKKAAHTLSINETTRKEVRQCHPVRLILVAQKKKDEACILQGISSLMYDLKSIYLF